MVFAGRAAAHVDHLARKRHRFGRVAPLERPLVVRAHGLQERRLARLLAVDKLILSTAPQSLDQARVYGGC